MNPPDRGQNWIGGAWSDSVSGQQLERRNPADHADLLGAAPLSTRAEMRAGIAAARQALPGWRATPAPRRGEFLFAWKRLLELKKDELARLITREEGKTLAEAAGEIQRGLNIVEYIAGEARRLSGETLPSELPANFIYTLRQPLGVVGLITPWNFPAAIPLWKLAPALVCGNTVVWKPSELTPFSSQFLARSLAEAGLPTGVVNLVHGRGQEAGDELVTHPDVAAISFTGSNAAGTAIYTRAAAGLKKVQCEMGGKNAVVVLEDADLELAAGHIIAGAFGSSGQRCTATSRLIVVEAAADRLLRLLLERIQSLKIGNGAEAGVQVGPIVSEAQYQRVLDYIQTGRTEARLCCGGQPYRENGCGNGWFIAPTVFDEVSVEARIAQEEIFGPVLPMLRVPDFEAALKAANQVKFGLAGSIFTRDVNRAFAAAERFECGMLHINSPTVGGEAHVPFGGIKATGVGERETGSTAIDFYSEIKVIYVDYTGQKRTGRLY